MTITDIAELEQVSVRSAQRYVTEGYKGIKIPAVKAGRSFSIAESDYKAWRVLCGFDETPAVVAALPPASGRSGNFPEGALPDEASSTPGVQRTAPCAEYPPYPLVADPHGVLTNCPSEHSCNFPHPLAVQDHMRHEAQKLVEKYQGAPYAVPEDLKIAVLPQRSCCCAGCLCVNGGQPCPARTTVTASRGFPRHVHIRRTAEVCRGDRVTPTYEQLQEWFTPARAARFWRKVEKNATPEGCWLWRGSCADGGHGQVYCCGHNVRVHRLTWMIARKRSIPEFIPDSRGEFAPFVVRHLMCDHANCCNPAHLVGGTPEENVRDTWQIHIAYRADAERRAREDYSEHPFLGYFSENLTPLPVVPQQELWVGFPLHYPPTPLQSLPTL